MQTNTVARLHRGVIQSASQMLWSSELMVVTQIDFRRALFYSETMRVSWSKAVIIIEMLQCLYFECHFYVMLPVNNLL